MIKRIHWIFHVTDLVALGFSPATRRDILNSPLSPQRRHSSDRGPRQTSWLLGWEGWNLLTPPSFQRPGSPTDILAVGVGRLESPHSAVIPATGVPDRHPGCWGGKAGISSLRRHSSAGWNLLKAAEATPPPKKKDLKGSMLLNPMPFLCRPSRAFPRELQCILGLTPPSYGMSPLQGFSPRITMNLGANATKLWDVAPPGLYARDKPYEGFRCASHPRYTISPTRGYFIPSYVEFCSPFTVHCSPFTVHCSLFPVPCSPFIVHHSLFTVHCSSFIIHNSLFILHHTFYILH